MRGLLTKFALGLLQMRPQLGSEMAEKERAQSF